MKVLILAGGYGSRLSEETDKKPKPMVEIGGKPILWHILKIYSHYGFNEFVILLGYKGYVIKEYFANYFMHQSDVTVDLEHNNIEIHNVRAEPWKVTLMDTGQDTMTGGRIKQARKYLNDETFMLTYGDGLCDINLKSLLSFHRKHKKLVSVTSVQPGGRFGALCLDANDRVQQFIEKPSGDHAWINGGFFICEPEAIEYIHNDNSVWEKEPLENLANDGQLMAFKHKGFWQAMDTLRDKNELNRMWKKGKPEWCIWT